jgi:uncharacterized protein DUF664
LSWSDVKLFNIMIHVFQETTRHAGHADILREQIDGRTGLRAEYEEQIDAAAREAYRAKIEPLRGQLPIGSRHADLSEHHGAIGLGGTGGAVEARTRACC